MQASNSTPQTEISPLKSKLEHIQSSHEFKNARYSYPKMVELIQAILLHKNLPDPLHTTLDNAVQKIILLNDLLRNAQHQAKHKELQNEIDQAHLEIYRQLSTFHFQEDSGIDGALIKNANELKKILQEYLMNLKPQFIKSLQDAQKNMGEFFEKKHSHLSATAQRFQSNMKYYWTSLSSNEWIKLIENLEQLHTSLKKEIRSKKPNSCRFFFHSIMRCSQRPIMIYQNLQACEKMLAHHLLRIKKDVFYQYLLLASFPDTKSATPHIEWQTKDRSYLNDMGLPTSEENVTKPRATYRVSTGNRFQHYSNTSDDELGRQGAFSDIISTIKKARHVIFIMGWIFEPQYCYPTRETSGDVPDQPKTLGEILVNKAVANPDLEIAILVWNQVIGTEHHKTAFNYLKQIATNLGLKALPPNLQFRSVKRTGYMWSHHQKCVLVDDGQSLIGFYGSADFAGGRFDWHGHPILDREDNNHVITRVFHKNGIYRHRGLSSDKFTPRIPYREVVSRAQGPIPHDIMMEFVTRWCAKSQGAHTAMVGSLDPENRVLHCFNRIRSQGLLDYDVILPDFAKTDAIWNAQFVRSGESCVYNSDWKLDRPYEKSIHKAMLQAINHAEKFIYIETQFFISKSHNRIPQALAKKIIECHQAGKPFHVFIVLPSSPESEPYEAKTGNIKEQAHATLLNRLKLSPLRYAQWKTLRWLKQEIEKNTGGNWEDYVSLLLFAQWHQHSPAESKSCHPKKAVYIHSKLMIIDDRIIINGSANLNERSLAGCFDTEGAVYQWPKEGHEEACIAEIRKFRRHIWQIYFGSHCMKELKEAGFNSPEQRDHIAIIKKVAALNFQKFKTGESSATEETGYVLAWPYGKNEFFPYVSAQGMPDGNKMFKWHPDDNETAPIALSAADFLGLKMFY